MSGLDVGIYSLYRFFTNTYFDLVSAWLDASPGRTVEMRMFAQGLILTDELANIKAIIMSTEVSHTTVLPSNLPWAPGG